MGTRRFECLLPGGFASGATHAEFRDRGAGDLVFGDGHREPSGVSLARAMSLVRRGLWTEVVPPSRPRRSRGKVKT